MVNSHDLTIRGVARTGDLNRLLVMDVDSTLAATEGLDLVAEAAGVGERVGEITDRAMRGEMTFAESFAERVCLLRGRSATAIEQALTRQRLNDGARELCSVLHRQGWRIGLVSGGIDLMVRPLAEELDIALVRCNAIEIVDGVMTGRITGPIVGRQAKAETLRQWARKFRVPREGTVAMGDGANDLDMLEVAGLGVAFHGKPTLRAAADARIDDDGLDALLPILLDAGLLKEE